MSRTVSARIPTALHEELRERCNLVGESINDFIKTAIEFTLYETTDFKDEIIEKLEKQKFLMKNSY
jgi:predicted DNA-binding protein